MIKTTLIYLIDDENRKVCLGMKLRGFGQGKFNGFGGKLNEGETIEDSAIRELREETGVVITSTDLIHVGYLEFYFQDRPDHNHSTEVFLIRSSKEKPLETEEMKPEWFDFDELPFEKMWEDDRYWLPKVLIGEKIIGRYIFNEGKIVDQNLAVLEEGMSLERR